MLSFVLGFILISLVIIAYGSFCLWLGVKSERKRHARI